MVAAWTPFACAPLAGRSGTTSGERVGALLLLIFPEATASEPFQDGIGMPRLELTQGRYQLVAGVSAERRWLPFQNDRPVMVPRRHAADYGSFVGCVCGSRRLSFSISVVRFRFSSFAA